MAAAVISRALRDQTEDAAVAIPVALRAERLRRFPGLRIAAGAVEIEQNPLILRKGVALPVERPAGAPADHQKERRKTSDFLNTALEIIFVAAGEAPADNASQLSREAARPALSEEPNA